MNSVTLTSWALLITVEFIVAVSCEVCDTNWGSCSATCGGGRQSRNCYNNYYYNINDRYTATQQCAQTCLHGYSYSGGCQCPAYRTGSCCETCRPIDIPYCHTGREECGGTQDGIRCTSCMDTYYSAGYNQGCLDCMDIDNCTVGHNICHGPSYADTTCTQCDLGYYSGGYGNGCKECTKTVPNCKSYACSNGTFSFCLECNPNYWLINNGTAEQFCFSLVEFPHEDCQGQCMVVYEAALPWKRANDVCEARGGHLFVPESNHEEDTLRNYMEAVIGHIFGHEWFWIGGQLQTTDNVQWLRSAGHVDRWGFPKPRATTETLCIGMDAKDSLLWNAYQCDQSAYFVCEERTPYNHVPYVVG